MALGWKGQYLRYKDYFLNITDVYKKRTDIRMFLEVVLSIGAVTIFLLFALKPTAITIVGLLKEINEKELTISGLDKKIGDLATARKLFSQETPRIQKVETAVPTNPDIDVLVKQTQGLAAKNSVNLLSFSVGEITIFGPDQKKKTSLSSKALPQNAKEIPVTLSISGTYPSLILFINDMENFRRSIKIDTLTVSSSESAEGKTIVVIVSGRFPYLGQN